MSVTHPDAVVRGGQFGHPRDRLCGAVALEPAQVKREAGGLGLDEGARVVGDDDVDARHDLIENRPALCVEPTYEVDVELAAVAAHQADLFGQAAQGGKISQSATRDDRDRGLRQLGQRANRHHGLATRERLGRIVDERGEGAVVVARHQQAG